MAWPALLSLTALGDAYAAKYLRVLPARLGVIQSLASRLTGSHASGNWRFADLPKIAFAWSDLLSLVAVAV